MFFFFLLKFTKAINYNKDYILHTRFVIVNRKNTL